MGDIGRSNGRLPRRRGDHRARVYRPGPFALIYAGMLAAGLFATAVVYAVLVHDVPGMRANRSDTLKTALLVIGGSGALAGLYVAYRKQRTDEANHLRDQDKLFTERYTAAVAQLGNTTSAAIRLGGVYALARIADDSERDRPTCLKVLCAYLRMPYDPDDPATEPAERQVRITAQTVIAERLHPDDPRFWLDAQIDLTGAHLFDLDFHGVTVAGFKADHAIFTGTARFGKAKFSGTAQFAGAKFSGAAQFSGATFSQGVWFGGATFARTAGFGEAIFSGTAWFGGAAWFGETTFSGTAWFGGATFSEMARFDRATFNQHAGFDRTTFSKFAQFSGATFSRAHPPRWPDGFAEPAEILWDPPDPALDLDASADPAHPPTVP